MPVGPPPPHQRSDIGPGHPRAAPRRFSNLYLSNGLDPANQDPLHARAQSDYANHMLFDSEQGLFPLAVVEAESEATEAARIYLIRLCKALMMFGAPTYRLESLMSEAAKSLGIDAVFLYLPNCMLSSFEDKETRISETHLIRVVPGTDLGRVCELYDIYKAVCNDRLGLREATEQLDVLIKRDTKYKTWFLVFMYGLAALSAGPLAFDAQWVDLPMAFILGCILGVLRLIWATRSNLYMHLLESVGAMTTVFLARAISSLGNYQVFCFSSMARSSYVMLLPGYGILIGVLELQCRCLVSGAARIIYSIVYLSTLALAIMLGILLAGSIIPNAAVEMKCENPITGSINDYLFMPLFMLSLMVVNQSKWCQMLPMASIGATSWYTVRILSRYHGSGNRQLYALLETFTLSALANFYSISHKKIETSLEWTSSCLSRWSVRFRSSRWRIPWSKKDRSPRSGTPDLEHGPRVTMRTSWIARVRDHIENQTLALKMFHGEFKEGPALMEDPMATGFEKRKVRRIRPHNLVAAAMIMPGMFLFIPAQIASTGTLVQALWLADKITSDREPGAIVQTPGYGVLSISMAVSTIEICVAMAIGIILGSVVVHPRAKEWGQSKPRKQRLRGTQALP